MRFSFEKKGSKRTHPPRSSHGSEIDDSDAFFECPHNSAEYQSCSRHVRSQAQEPLRFFPKRDRLRRCRLSGGVSQPHSWSRCGRYCAAGT